MVDRIDKFLRVRLLQKESEEWKEKSLWNFPFHLTSSGRAAAVHLLRWDSARYTRFGLGGCSVRCPQRIFLL